MSHRPKWPYDATEELRFTIRVTPGQLESWREALRQSAERRLDKWLVCAVNFFVWYWGRERELLKALHEQLDREAEERRAKEREPW